MSVMFNFARILLILGPWNARPFLRSVASEEAALLRRRARAPRESAPFFRNS